MMDGISAEDHYILHWGEMGTRWGINRAVAQIHALLYLSPRPLNAEQISERLGVARSTVSTGLRELQSWGLVKLVHELGDRRDYFETMTDVWEMFRLVLRERKRREVDPTLAMLRENVAELESDGAESSYASERVREMLEFFEVMSAAYEQAESLPTSSLKTLAMAGDGLGRVMKAAAR